MVTLQQVDCFIENFKTLSREGGDADLNISSRGGGLVVMLSLHIPNAFPQSSKSQNQRTPVKPKVKRKNDDSPCKARRKAKRASDRAKSVDAASSEASAGMVEADHAADVMAISTPAPLHSAEMADIATTSAAVMVPAASPKPSSVPTKAVAVMAATAQLPSADKVDATLLSSADTVDTIQLSAETVHVDTPKSSVMEDKPSESSEKVETVAPLPKSAEKVAITSQVTKHATPSTDTDTEITENEMILMYLRKWNEKLDRQKPVD